MKYKIELKNENIQTSLVERIEYLKYIHMYTFILFFLFVVHTRQVFEIPIENHNKVYIDRFRSVFLFSRTKCYNFVYLKVTWTTTKSWLTACTWSSRKTLCFYWTWRAAAAAAAVAPGQIPMTLTQILDRGPLASLSAWATSRCLMTRFYFNLGIALRHLRGYVNKRKH